MADFQFVPRALVSASLGTGQISADEMLSVQELALGERIDRPLLSMC